MSVGDVSDAKRRAGHDLIVRAIWLQRNPRDLSEAELRNARSFEARMRFVHDDPDPDWIEARLLDYADFRRRLGLDVEVPEIADEDGMPEIRG